MSSRLRAFAAFGLPLAIASAGSAQQYRSSGPSLIGIWNGQVPTQQGTVPITVEYRPDGTTQAVALTQVPGFNGPVYMHLWGHYRADPTGQGRFRTHIRIEGHAPAEACTSVNGSPPSRCQQLPGPGGSDGTVEFTSADSFRDETGAAFVRAQGRGLLARQVGPRLTLNMHAAPPRPYSGGGGNGGGGGYVSVRPATPAHPGNLQQERVCTINDGTLVTHPDGSEECMGPN